MPVPKILVLDTNFLLIPYQYTVDIFTQLDELVPGAKKVVARPVLDELEDLAGGKGKQAAAARFALLLLSRQKWEMIETDLPADRWILEYARQHRAIVCTNDRALRQRIKRLPRRCIVLKKRNWIGFG